MLLNLASYLDFGAKLDLQKQIEKVHFDQFLVEPFFVVLYLRSLSSKVSIIV